MRGPGFTIMIHRDGALESRQWHMPRWMARLIAGLATVLTVAALTIGILYGPIVTAAARTPLLERRIARLEEENLRVGELAQRLDEAEARYTHLRGMLGADIALPDLEVTDIRTGGSERLYVAPPLEARAPNDTGAPVPAADSPFRWPLSVSSFRTRGLAQGDPGTETHMGLDLAVPVGSDVRAAANGIVRATGTDSAYGLYVLLEHADGYETMYGHLSRALVTNGATVRGSQVIALSGNTGRSTAPHLHFEIRRGGRSLDPLTLVREGN